jgi:hypothetical protein
MTDLKKQIEGHRFLQKVKEGEYELEDLWDVICMRTGFDSKGREIQNLIRRFVEKKFDSLLLSKCEDIEKLDKWWRVPVGRKDKVLPVVMLSDVIKILKNKEQR